MEKLYEKISCTFPYMSGNSRLHPITATIAAQAFLFYGIFIVWVCRNVKWRKRKYTPTGGQWRTIVTAQVELIILTTMVNSLDAKAGFESQECTCLDFL